jgi:hypothetical protein
MIDATSNVITRQKEISIFKTNLKQENEIQNVSNILNLIVGNDKWNFDLEDIDHILRIHANTVVNGFLIKEIEKLGYKCEELF